MKYIPNAMKCGNQSMSSSLIINMIFEIADLDGLIFMKFGTQNRSNVLIINILIGIDNLYPNYKFAKFGPETETCSNFHEIWHSGHF